MSLNDADDLANRSFRSEKDWLYALWRDRPAVLEHP